MNLYTYKKIREINKKLGEEKNRKIPGTQHVEEAKMLLQENAEQKYKKSRKLRQQVHRMGGQIQVILPGVEPEGKKSISTSSVKELAEIARRKESEKGDE